jgi:hypothetical protein
VTLKHMNVHQRLKLNLRLRNQSSLLHSTGNTNFLERCICMITILGSCCKNCSFVCPLLLTLNHLMDLCENWYSYHATRGHPTFTFLLSHLSNSNLHKPFSLRKLLSPTYWFIFQLGESKGRWPCSFRMPRGTNQWS